MVGVALLHEVFRHREPEADGQLPCLHALVPAFGGAALVGEVHGTGAIGVQCLAELQAEPVFCQSAPHPLAGQDVAACHGVQDLPRRQVDGPAVLG